MKRANWMLVMMLVFAKFIFAIPADDVKQAQNALKHERSALLNQIKEKGVEPQSVISRMLDLGMWHEAKIEMAQNKTISPSVNSLLEIQYLLLNNRFSEAELSVRNVLAKDSQNRDAKRFLAQLNIEAWKLKDAEELAKQLLSSNKDDKKTALVLGRALLLQKKYDEALQLALQLQKSDSTHAQAYLLEADVYFWNQQPQKAEAPLVKSIELDPFNPDARFSYGYAIWRRVDATQLNDMAAQWELALEINPLHFSTHWHWGNGHTNLTFADYVDQDEKEIRKKLAPADKLFSAGKLKQALEIIQTVGKEYPKSVLPAIHEASLLYSDFESESRVAELARSEQLFRDILKHKKNYGPAHNGLAAVIKSQRMRYLSNFDSISTVLSTLVINDPVNFQKVFPDMGYYPGKQVQAMVWNQLFTSVVYFPFLSKQQDSFIIPPLHVDLAIAMNSPYFRTNTTFDNRQWMDIRGVGSGAADIGYTERGAYFERNVVLHEYVHLFHGRVLTDEENRAIRKHYYNAMENNLTLDYYSRNNESEYFAQTYPAYFEPMKVHPLDFKSMNTTSDLKNKDPEMYGFLDQLVKKEQAYLSGDTKVMASNWAQVYMNMSRKVEREDMDKATLYLDTALLYDQGYIPAYLAFAQLEQRKGEVKNAVYYLEKAQALDLSYAPTYAAFADFIQKQFLKKKSVKDPKGQQVSLLEKAISLEKDYQTASNLHIQLRTVYADFDDMENAILIAENYAKNGPVVSTYLRDRVDEAKAFAVANKAFLGNMEELQVLGGLVKQKPQNYNFRALYSDALFANKEYQKSIDNIKEVQRILQSSGNARTDFDLRIAENLVELNQVDRAKELLKEVMEKKNSLDTFMGLRLVSVLIKIDRKADARRIFEKLPKEGTVVYEKERKAILKSF